MNNPIDVAKARLQRSQSGRQGSKSQLNAILGASMSNVELNKQPEMEPAGVPESFLIDEYLNDLTRFQHLEQRIKERARIKMEKTKNKIEKKMKATVTKIVKEKTEQADQDSEAEVAVEEEDEEADEEEKERKTELLDQVERKEYGRLAIEFGIVNNGKKDEVDKDVGKEEKADVQPGDEEKPGADAEGTVPGLFGPEHPHMKSIQYLNSLSALGGGLLSPEARQEQNVMKTIDYSTSRPHLEAQLHL